MKRVSFCWHRLLGNFLVDFLSKKTSVDLCMFFQSTYFPFQLNEAATNCVGDKNVSSHLLMRNLMKQTERGMTKHNELTTAHWKSFSTLSWRKIFLVEFRNNATIIYYHLIGFSSSNSSHCRRISDYSLRVQSLNKQNDIPISTRPYSACLQLINN